MRYIALFSKWLQLLLKVRTIVTIFKTSSYRCSTISRSILLKFIRTFSVPQTSYTPVTPLAPHDIKLWLRRVQILKLCETPYQQTQMYPPLFMGTGSSM